jgi:predicted transcriptional regulator
MTTTVRDVPVAPDLARRLKATSKRATEATVERDRLIVEAHRAGGGVREIARLVGMTHPGVLRILKRDTGT